MQPPPPPPPPPPPTLTDTEEAARLERRQRNEIGHLTDRVEGLRRRLRRLTLVLGCALVVILVLAGALAILVVRLRGGELPLFLIMRL